MSDGELLAVVDEAGEPVLGPGGQPLEKRRDEVHRDGDWHEAFHLWIVCPDGVLLQRRAARRAAWPLRLDASAAGHLLAGESALDGLREAEEELGVAFDPAALTGIGTFKVDDDRGEGRRNREHQHLFAIADDRPLADYDRLCSDEVAALVAVPPDRFAALVAGGSAEGLSHTPGEGVTAVTVEHAELVPAPYLNELADRLRTLPARATD